MNVLTLGEPETAQDTFILHFLWLWVAKGFMQTNTKVFTDCGVRNFTSGFQHFLCNWSSL